MWVVSKFASEVLRCNCTRPSSASRGKQKFVYKEQEDVLLNQVAVVPHGDVAALGKLEGRVDSHLLAGGLAERLCPRQLTRVALHLEVLVAL